MARTTFDNPPGTLTFAQLAERWGCTGNAVRKRYRKDRLLGIRTGKFGRIRVFDLKSVEAFEVASGRVE